MRPRSCADWYTAAEIWHDTPTTSRCKRRVIPHLRSCARQTSQSSWRVVPISALALHSSKVLLDSVGATFARLDGQRPPTPLDQRDTEVQGEAVERVYTAHGSLVRELSVRVRANGSVRQRAIHQGGSISVTDARANVARQHPTDATRGGRERRRRGMPVVNGGLTTAQRNTAPGRASRASPP